MRNLLTINTLGLMCFLSSCGPQQTTAISSKTPEAPAHIQKSEILYLFFTIERQADGSETVRHTATTVAEGKLKNKTDTDASWTNGNLILTFTDAAGKTVMQRIVQNPLKQPVEVFTPGGMERDELKLQKADFSIRLNKTSELAAMKVEKIQNNAKIQLLTLKL